MLAISQQVSMGKQLQIRSAEHGPRAATRQGRSCSPAMVRSRERTRSSSRYISRPAAKSRRSREVLLMPGGMSADRRRVLLLKVH